MAHVGVESLATGDDEDDRPEDVDPAEAVPQKELDAPPGRESPDNLRLLEDLPQPQKREGREPNEHHRAEQLPDVAGATRLDREQADEDQAGDRNDEALEGWAGDGEPFDGRKHGDRRCDHAVAIEERRADDGQERHPGDTADPAGGVAVAIGHEGQERQDPPFPAMIGPHHKDDVLHRDDEDQRPEHEREDAEKIGAVDGVAVGGGDMEAFFERVEGACADVAKDHAEREKRKAQDAAPASPMGVRGGGAGAMIHQRLLGLWASQSSGGRSPLTRHP